MWNYIFHILSLKDVRSLLKLVNIRSELFSTKWQIISHWNRSSRPEVFLKIPQNSQENTCGRVSFLIKLQVQVCNFIKKETLVLVFSCEFCEISKNNFLTEHLWTTALWITLPSFSGVNLPTVQCDSFFFNWLEAAKAIFSIWVKTRK